MSANISPFLREADKAATTVNRPLMPKGVEHSWLEKLTCILWRTNRPPYERTAAPKTGHIWYTDTRSNVFRIKPDPPYEVTEYKLLSADQAVGGGRGESRGRTPYGIDIAPDGMVWYAKLNGNRIGRINPDVEDGDIKEWNPPFRGPRRLQVDQDGIIWVPSSGARASSEPSIRRRKNGKSTSRLTRSTRFHTR